MWDMMFFLFFFTLNSIVILQGVDNHYFLNTHFKLKYKGMWKNRVKMSQMQVKRRGLFYSFTASCICDYLQNSTYAS